MPWRFYFARTMSGAPLSAKPRYSILITSYRSLRFLEDCVGSVLRAPGPSIEVLFLENGSPEPEADWLEKHYGHDSRLRIFRVPETRYFAGGINYLARHARGEFLVLLNSDTRAEPEWLQVIDDYLRAGGFEAAQADLREARNPAQRESLGYTVDRLGFIEHYTEELKPHERMFGARGAAFAVRRDVYEEIGGLDESFRMYFEETDLCWRINLYGYRIGYATGAIVYHLGGGSARPAFFPMNHFRFVRNRLLALVKNYGAGSLLVFMPLHIFACMISAFALLLRGKVGKALAELTALPASLFLMGEALRQRVRVQAGRRVSDAELVRLGLVRRRFKYFRLN